MAHKKKIVFISDHPLIPSGVGTQAKYLIEGLLETGKYKFFCLGGAVKHPKYNLQSVEPAKYGDDWTILPVDGYGTKPLIRQILATEKPDAIVIFTDPRFFVWLWEIEDEVRAVCPLLYWHVWDNDPAPDFNKIFYHSTDRVVSLSLKTHGMMKKLDVRSDYVPHALPPTNFRPLPEADIQEYKKKYFGPHADKKFIVFWNNRNARRKQTGDVVASFAKFAHDVGRDKVALMMHTNPKDQEGQDIIAVAKTFGIDSNVMISEERVTPADLNYFYNVCDVTINIASNEGFGLGTLESLMAGTPIVVHMTGGLQFQIGDWWQNFKDFSDQEYMTSKAKAYHQSGRNNWWGVPVFPASRSCTGSQQIPYIYDDRVCHEDVVKALKQMYNMGRGPRRQLGLAASEWAKKTFSIEKMINEWDRIIEEELHNRKTSKHLFRSATL